MTAIKWDLVDFFYASSGGNIRSKILATHLRPKVSFGGEYAKDLKYVTSLEEKDEPKMALGTRLFRAKASTFET